jgi:amino acid transporter
VSIEADDALVLHQLGYEQELRRQMGGFSNFALSFTIICILAGGVTSFHLGVCGVGGASVGLGWPLVGLFALAVAATMAQVASAFPTAGGLYHWASLLGGRGWGWTTGWLNLLGLITVLAAVNVGTWTFLAGSVGPLAGVGPGMVRKLAHPAVQAVAVALITFSQAMLNHRGIRLTTRLTDLSGYLILAVCVLLTAAMIAFAPGLNVTRLFTFANYSGAAGGGVWPATLDVGRLFALGLLLPAYTLTGFDASAHAAEETVGASRAVPLGIVRSVAVAGLAGWVMLAAVVASVPDLKSLAARGGDAFPWALRSVLPNGLAAALGAGIVVAMYGCGLGAVTSASRMAYAFARDGGLPFSKVLRWVCPRFKTPAPAVWAVAIGSWLFTVWTPFYATITAVCTIFLYLSYVLPTALGAWAYGRTWTRMGPWNLGRWYRPLAAICVLGCLGVVVVAMHPPNQRSAWVLGGTLLTMAVFWFGYVRRRFTGPPATADMRKMPAAEPAVST